MRSWKKALVLLLAITLLAGTMQGCSKPQSSNTTGEKQTSENVPVPANMNATGFPIVKEPLTLKFVASLSAYHGPWEKMDVLIEYEKKSGIHIEWETINPTAYPEKKSLKLASNELPDAFYRGRLSGQDIALYGAQQGTFIPLNNLVDKYAPNLKKAFQDYPEAKRSITAPDGKYYTIPEINGDLSGQVNYFIWINQKWLDKVGMKMPTTTEEYYQVLTAFRDKDPNGNGKKDEIPMGSNKDRYFLPLLRGSFGIGSTCTDYEMDKASKIFYNRIDPRYKEMLEYINKLYTEGLMEKETYTLKNADTVARIAQGIVGSYYYPNPDVAGLTGEKAAEYVGMGVLKGPRGEMMYTSAEHKVASNGMGTYAITNVNKHPEATIRWVDYWFSQEGNEFLHGGIKGKHYNLGPSGEIVFTDLVAKDPKGLNNAAGQFTTWPGGVIPRIMNEKTDPSPKNYDNAKTARKLAEPYLPKEIWPAFILSPEENDIMVSVGGDIDKYVNEMETKFVTGKEPFSAWDSYVENVKKMGLDKVLKVQQAAYDRYKNTK